MGQEDSSLNGPTLSTPSINDPDIDMLKIEPDRSREY